MPRHPAVWRRAQGRGLGDPALAIGVLLEQRRRALGDAGGQSSHARHLHAIALGAGPRRDPVQKNRAIVPFGDRHTKDAHTWQRLREIGQFVIVGGEEGSRADVIVQIFDDGAGDR